MPGPVSPAPAARAQLAWILTRSAWPLASVAALYLCGVVESLWPIQRLNAGFVVSMAALLLLFGLAHGAVWAAAFRLLRLLPAPLAFCAWLAASLSSAFWLAQRLGAFTRLNSRYSKLAIATLLASGAAGLAFGALCAALQPTAARPEGFLLSRSARARRILALLLMAAFAGLQIADRRFPSSTRWRTGRCACPRCGVRCSRSCWRRLACPARGRSPGCWRWAGTWRVSCSWMSGASARSACSTLGRGHQRCSR